jgi:phosphoribosylformylglycinamidine synthase PurS subunit
VASSGVRTSRVEVRVELKPEVADAEAESVARSLALLGIGGLRRVRIARLFDLEFEGVDLGEAERRAKEAVDRLLANPVIHRVSIRPVPEPGR